MSLRAGLVAHLKADTALAALVSDRIYHEGMPQDVQYPAVAYAKTSAERFPTLSGYTSLQKARVSIDVWASTSTDAIAVAEAVKAALDGVTDFLGTQSIQICTFESDADLSQFDGDRKDRHLSLEFVVWFNE